MLTFPALKELEQRIKDDWKAGSAVSVCAGKRSGKSVLINSIISDFSVVLIFGMTVRVLTAIYPDREKSAIIRRFGENSDFVKYLKGENYTAPADPARSFEQIEATILQANHCIIIDEPFYTHDSEKLFDAVSSKYKNVLAIGGRNNFNWKAPLSYSYSTFDLNPHLKPLDPSVLNEFQTDFERAFRDYNIQDANNDDHYEFFMTWKDIANSYKS